MANTSSQKIAKNSLFLYLRMLVMMGVTLYTSRVVLEMLGVVDFGIYNVLAGVVAMMSIYTSLSNATQRYLNVGLANNDAVATRRYFNQSVSLYVVVAIALFILANTVGLWFVKAKLVIPAGRETAAFWAYEGVIGMVVVLILQIPYMSVVIARERMSVFAYMGLFEAASKLACAYLLIVSGGADRLILYSFLLMGCSLLNTLIYVFYCRRFPETRLAWVWDMKLIRDMGKFIGINAFGSFMWVIGTQGINIVLNLFFGPVVNAARGVALQVNTALTRLMDGVYTAARPQLTQSFATGDTPRMHTLIHKGSVYSCLLFCMLAVPLTIAPQTVLGIWLKNVPEYSAAFLQLVLLDTFFYSLQVPLGMGANATGRPKRSMGYGPILLVVAMVISYIVFKLNSGDQISPTFAFWVLAASKAVYWLYSLYDMHDQLDMKYRHYMHKVLYPILIVLIPDAAACWIVSQFIQQPVVNLIAICAVSAVVTGLLTYLFVMGKTERGMVDKVLRKFIRK